MSTEFEVFRVVCEKKPDGSKARTELTENEPPNWGTAFLVKDNMLITCKHVIEHGMDSHAYSIKVLPNNDGAPIECRIFEWDEDEFTESTIVLLKTREILPKKVKTDEDGHANINPYPQKLQGFISLSSITPVTGVVSVLPMANMEDAVIVRDDTLERTNQQIHVSEINLTNYKGLSGSPMYDQRGNIFGIFNAQNASLSGNVICGYGYCNAPFHLAKKRVLDKADQKEKEETAKKAEEERKAAEEPIPSFAEYVAEVCNDCLTGFCSLDSLLSEYKNLYSNGVFEKDTKSLELFEQQIWTAATDCDKEFVSNTAREAMETLKDLYKDMKQCVNVYASALFMIFYNASQRKSDEAYMLESAKMLLDVDPTSSFGYDFPQRHLLLAEYHALNSNYPELNSELETADQMCNRACLIEECAQECDRVCWNETCCHADVHFMMAGVPMADGKERDAGDIIAHLQHALDCYPDIKRERITQIESKRRQSTFEANSKRFGHALLNWQRAYLMEKKAGVVPQGSDDAEKCLHFLCAKKLDYCKAMEVNGWGEWVKFQDDLHGKMCEIGYSYSIPDKMALEAKRYFLRLKADDCIREIGRTVVKKSRTSGANDGWSPMAIGVEIQGEKPADAGLRTEVLYIDYDETMIQYPERLKLWLDECVTNDCFLLKCSGIMGPKDTFQEQCDHYNKSILSNAPVEYIVEPLMLERAKLDDDRYLYAYHYWKEDSQYKLPVWHLFYWNG